MIRIEMVEHIPLIAEFSLCHHLYSDVNLVSFYLLPVIVQYLSDPNSQVCRSVDLLSLSLLLVFFK